MAAKRKRKTAPPRRVRYAVVGLGHIAQIAVLPAFRNARRNSRLAAIVSGDDTKLDVLRRRYKVETAVHYDQLDDLFAGGEIDAVYIALPNDLHRAVVLKAAEAGIHVLCEKPLAMTETDCLDMIEACEAAEVRLMTAYRLHYEPATLRAIELVRAGRIGEPRFFTSTFSMQVTDPANIRLKAERGGGPLFDLGIYCINAARSLFASEPLEVTAFHAAGDDDRFREVPEMSSALIRFPRERLATFVCSFGAGDTSSYRIIGTRGDIHVEPAYEHAEGLEFRLTIGDRTTRRRFRRTDQFGAELLAFSDSVLNGPDPEPSGWEGLADVRIMEAVERSAIEGRAIQLTPFGKLRRPRESQRKTLRPPRRPDEVHSTAPHD
ncbi:MAG: Gfo/Idh/MocA family protein [Gemmatimonadota bacterium]